MLSWVLLSGIGSHGEGGPEVTANITWNHSTCASMCVTCLNGAEESAEKVASQSVFRRTPPPSCLLGMQKQRTGSDSEMVTRHRRGVSFQSGEVREGTQKRYNLTWVPKEQKEFLK